MSAQWPKVRLGEVLRLDLDRVPIDPAISYPMVGVLSFGKGLFDREPIENGKTSYKYFCRLKPNHVVMSQLFGWEGALALSSEKYAGKFLSPQFPTFTCDEKKLDRKFLGWIMRRPAFWEDLGSRAIGMGDRRRTLNPKALFSSEIPLPPLAEQKRIVARIEEIAAQINEARALRQKIKEETIRLSPAIFESCFSELTENYRSNKIEDICEVVRGGSPRPAGSPIFYGGEIPFIKVGDLTKDEGKFLLEASDSVNEQGCKHSRFIESGTLMLTNSGATLGVPKITKISGCFNDGSQAFLNLSPKIEKEYLYYFFKARTFWFRDQLARGQGQPNLNTEMTKNMEVPLPPIDEQCRIVAKLDAFQAKIEKLKSFQAETSEELHAFLPSILDRAFKGEL